jgi:hypothetical protein
LRRRGTISTLAVGTDLSARARIGRRAGCTAAVDAHSASCAVRVIVTSAAGACLADLSITALGARCADGTDVAGAANERARAVCVGGARWYAHARLATLSWGACIGKKAAGEGTWDTSAEQACVVRRAVAPEATTRHANGELADFARVTLCIALASWDDLGSATTSSAIIVSRAVSGCVGTARDASSNLADAVVAAAIGVDQALG